MLLTQVLESGNLMTTMKTLTTTLIIFCFTALAAVAQVDDPLSLAQTIFSRDGFPELESYITGEYNGHPNGTDLQANVTTSFLLLAQHERTAVVCITMSDSTGKEFDMYLHFKKEGGWKASAFRSLAMTGVVAEVHQQLKSMSKAEVDRTIATAGQDTLGVDMFRSQAEYEFRLGSLGLVLASDRELISHFKNNESQFESIKEAVLTQMQTMTIDEGRQHPLGETLKSDHQKIFISAITSGGYQFGSAINFLIGGMIDNSVGYLYVTDPADVPSMHPDGIIMLREIGNGWYLYKTT